MASKARKIQTSFTSGELSPRLEGHTDLARFFSGAKTMENVLGFVQGGFTARPGTRFVAEAKDSSQRVYLFSHVVDRTTAYILEFGDQYIRFYRNGARLGAPYEIASPYSQDDIPLLQLKSSVDVIYIFHQNYATRKLSRLGDTNWTLTTIRFLPGASFLQDADISGGSATLTPAATTGTAINFTASSGVFLKGDEDRQIIFGTSRAVITSFTSTTVVVCDIIDDFPDTNPIAAGSWLLRGSPSSYCNVTKRGPIGGSVSVVGETSGGAGQNTFRSADIGKFVLLHGGCIELTAFTSATTMTGIIRTLLTNAANENPVAVGPGSWSLEAVSWSAANGFPRAGEFFEGRLVPAGTVVQPTTFWLSATDSYENFARGALANDALAYTIALREFNPIFWLVDDGVLLIGTAESIHRAKGAGIDEPLGGDSVPNVREQEAYGSLPIQPIKTPAGIIFIDSAGRKVIALAYNADGDKYKGKDLTKIAEHITAPSLASVHMAFQKTPDPRTWMVRSDGELLTLVYEPEEETLGFIRQTTQGDFESIAAIPHPDGDRYQVWLVAKRTVNGATKRYIEFFEDDASEIAGRAWTDIHLDCALLYNGAPANVITGLTHLEGMTVGVVADGSDRGDLVVAGGQITFSNGATYSQVEIGLRYTPKVVTMRPAFEGAMIEGLPRKWNSLFVKLLNSWGCRINGADALFPIGGAPMDTEQLFTGDKRITGQGWDTEGRVTIEQPQAYPLTVLALFGELVVGDSQ